MMTFSRRLAIVAGILLSGLASVWVVTIKGVAATLAAVALAATLRPKTA
jgi:hypothetical protein